MKKIFWCSIMLMLGTMHVSSKGVYYGAGLEEDGPFDCGFWAGPCSIPGVQRFGGE